MGGTLGINSREPETSAMREGLSVVLPQWDLRPDPPLREVLPETWVPGFSPLAKSSRHMLPPTPTCRLARERSTLAWVCYLSSSWFCQTTLCAGNLFLSPASVFTVSRVVLKTSHVLLFLSPETARAAPCHLLLAWPTKPSSLTPAHLSVSFTSASTICFTASLLPRGVPLLCSMPLPPCFLPFCQKTPAHP